MPRLQYSYPTGLTWKNTSGFFQVTQFQCNYAGDNLQDFIPALAPPRDQHDFTVPAGFFPVGYDPASSALFNDQAPFVPEVSRRRRVTPLISTVHTN